MNVVGKNNNVTVSGKYKMLWHMNIGSISALKKVLQKLGMNAEQMDVIVENALVEVEDNMNDIIVIKSGTQWDKMKSVETIKLGQIVEESGMNSRGSVYTSVWYRYGNMMVKQANPSNKQDSPYTLTREFNEHSMIMKISTNNNETKAQIVFVRM